MGGTSKSVTYESVYADTTRPFNGVRHVLLLFKGSVLKLIWHDVALFTAAYYALSLVYRLLLFDRPRARETFEVVCVFADSFSDLIPISFLTGFYVTQVVWRWWDQFMSLPWPDRVAFRLVTYCPGKDRFLVSLRRDITRYINLSTVLVYRMVSKNVKKRFPSHRELVDGKLLLPHESKVLLEAEREDPLESTWLPVLWALRLLQRARADGRICLEAPVYASLVSSIDHVEDCNRRVLNYSWVNFPLAYTQVAVLSVLTYFFAALFGRQYLIPREGELDRETFPHLNVSYSSSAPFQRHTPDFYVPVFTYIELVSYVGWIKVAEALLNPFGKDDDDFQVNYLIDRNLRVSYRIVDSASAFPKESGGTAEQEKNGAVWRSTSRPTTASKDDDERRSAGAGPGAGAGGDNGDGDDNDGGGEYVAIVASCLSGEGSED